MARDPGAFEQARRLVLAHGSNPTSYQILNPGIDWWFPDSGDAVVGYVDRSRVRVVAGNPVCRPTALERVIDQLEGDSRRLGRRVCFLGADADLYAVLARTSAYASIVVGAHPIVDPSLWAQTLERHGSLRAQLHRARNKSVEVDEWTADQATNHPELNRCLAAWLRGRGLPRLHFLVEPDALGFLPDRRVLVATQDGKVIGFLVASPVPARHGWQIELLVRGDDAPNGSMELLMDGAVRRLADQGGSYVALGAVPLSSMAPRDRAAPSAIRALLTWQRAHGRRFYNFEGLERFKAKFWPERWEPVYALANEPRFSLGTLYAVAGAYCAGSPLGTLLEAVARAGRQELRWLWQRANYPARRAAR